MKVPEMTPVAGSRLTPAGKLPLWIDQTKGVEPPPAVKVAE